MGHTPQEQPDDSVIDRQANGAPETADAAVTYIQQDASRAKEVADNGYSAYKQRGGEMTTEEFDAVQNQRMDQGDYGTAMRLLMSLNMGFPDITMVTKAAEIYGALKGKNSKVDNAQWLMAETYIHLNRM